MSFVPRVMSDAAEKRSISASENETTFLNRALRTSRAIFAAVRDAMRATNTEAITMTAVMPSMRAPIETSASICIA